MNRGIFVDLLSDKEVCSITAAQFSREDIIKYEGIEQGIKALIIDNLEDGKSKEVIIKKLVKRFDISEDKAREYVWSYSEENN